MSRILIATTLLLAAAGSNAAQWPWQDSQEEALGYCKGFVVGGLSSTQTQGPYRTDLWLAWNFIIRSTVAEKTVDKAEFQTGRDQFLSVADASTAQSVLDDADGTCGLGRSGHQVTGW